MDGATWLGYSPWGRKELDTTERLDSLIGRELEQTLGDSEGRGSLACYSSWGCKESDTT